MTLVHVHRLVTRALGVPHLAPVGWIADEENACWWRIDIDGRCYPLAQPQHPHFRSSVASDPCAGRP